MAKLEEVFGVTSKPVLSYVERKEVDDSFREALTSHNSSQVVEMLSTKEAELPKEEKGSSVSDPVPLGLIALSNTLLEVKVMAESASKRLDTLLSRKPITVSRQAETFSILGFSSGRSEVTPRMRAEILSLANRLGQRNSDNSPYQIDVVGYSDNSGEYRRNIQLGLERAQAVASLLMSEGFGRHAVLRTQTSGGIFKGNGDGKRVDVYV
ncbi:MAG: hypothetical protein EON58_18050, partial [Alphaproteobacteria bacterium]